MKITIFISGQFPHKATTCDCKVGKGRVLSQFSKVPVLTTKNRPTPFREEEQEEEEEEEDEMGAKFKAL